MITMESTIMTVRQIKIQAHPDHVGTTVTEDQDIPPRNMSLWQREYSELKKRRDTEKFPILPWFSITKDDSRLFPPQR